MNWIPIVAIASLLLSICLRGGKSRREVLEGAIIGMIFGSLGYIALKFLISPLIASLLKGILGGE